MPSPSTNSKPRPVLLALAGTWIAAALAIWLWRGWRLSFSHGLIPPVGPEEVPIQQLRALSSFAVLSLSSYGWGAWTTRLLRIQPERGPIARAAVVLATGQIVAALLTFVIGIAGLLPWGLLGLLAGLAGLRGEQRHLRPCASNIATRSKSIAGVLVAVAFALTLLVALGPVVESDGLRYHLFAPQEYLKAGRIVPLPYNAFTNLPFQTNMLFLASMAFGGGRAAHLVHWAYMPLAMVFAGLIARALARAVHASRGSQPVARESASRAAEASALLVGSLPVVLVLASWPFVDLSTMAFTLASVWALTPGALRRLDARLLLSGIFAGAAIGTKLPALVPGFLAGLVVLAILAPRPRKIARLALFCVPIAIVPGAWFAKNAIVHHNPVYPVAYGVFGGPEWSADTDAFYKAKAREKGMGRAPLDFVLSPLDIAIRWQTKLPQYVEDDFANNTLHRLFTRASPGYEDQPPGPAPLALLPVAIVLLGWSLVWRRRSPTVWLVAMQLAGGWLAWFATYQSVRFLMAPMAFAIIAGVVGLGVPATTPLLRRCARILTTVLACAGFAWHAVYILFMHPAYPAFAGTGWIAEERILSSKLNFYDAVRYLNNEVQPGEKVFYLGEFRGFYAQYPIVSSDWFDLPRVLVDIKATGTNDELLARWRGDRIRYVLYNLEELAMYSALYFEPRFTRDEWKRFEDLHARLVAPGAVVFSSEDHRKVMVIDLNRVR